MTCHQLSNWYDGYAALVSGKPFVALPGMDRGLDYLEGAELASTGLPPGVQEDKGAGSALTPAWESPQHAGYVGEERVFVGVSSDSQRPTALVQQPAIARLDSKHALAPAYTSIEAALGQAGAAQVLQEAPTTAQPSGVSSAADDVDGREGSPAQAMCSTVKVASMPGVMTNTSAAEDLDSREVCNSATLMQLTQAEHELPSASAAAREGEHPQAACSAALLASSEQLKPPGSSSAYGGESSSEARGAASSAAQEAPAGSTRISTLLAPSKTQLKRARKAAAMQRSAQGTPKAGVQKRAWQDWLARRSGEA